MGIIESLIGSPSGSEKHTNEPEDNIELSSEEYEVAYPIAVEREELASYAALIEVEGTTDFAKDPMGQQLIETIDDVLEENIPGSEGRTAEIAQQRDEVAQMIDFWKKQTSGEIGVIFAPVGADYRLKSYLLVCEGRNNDEHDPFSLPDEFIDAVSLSKRVTEAAEFGNSVLLKQDRMPTV